MKKQASKSVAAKLKKLALLARQLRAGEDFQITRLTVLKSWCDDPIAAGRFTLHLAEQSKGRATKKYKPLINNALRQLKRHLASPRKRAPESLWWALQELEDSQNEVRDIRWGSVRTIHCREALLAEHALRCVACPQKSAHWGYQAARQYPSTLQAISVLSSTGDSAQSNCSRLLDRKESLPNELGLDTRRYSGLGGTKQGHLPSP